MLYRARGHKLLSAVPHIALLLAGYQGLACDIGLVSISWIAEVRLELALYNGYEVIMWGLLRLRDVHQTRGQEAPP